MNTPKPGAYRALFAEGLELLIAELEEHGTTESDHQKLSDCRHYLKLLHDLNYKFGQQTSGLKVYAPGELFFRT